MPSAPLPNLIDFLPKEEAAAKLPVPRCALVMGLPGTREAFCDLETPSDYAISMFYDSPTSAWPRYAKSVALAKSLVETARSHGFTVYEQGDLGALRDGTAVHDVVIIFGHSSATTFTDRDFCAPGGEDKREKVIERLARPDIPFARLLNRFGSESPETLRRALNEAILGRSLFLGLLIDERPPTGGDILIEQMLCREMLDAAIGTLVIPGNQIELFGKLYDVGAAAAAIDSEFRGELALIICRSTALATAIELRFGLEVRMASWNIAVLPDGYYVVVEAVLRQLATTGGSFLDILSRFEGMLLELGEEERHP